MRRIRQRQILKNRPSAFVYDPAALAYFAELTPEPPVEYMQAINTFILSAKANGYWTEFDRLWVHSTYYRQHAQVSLVNPTSARLTEVNSPIWTALGGYKSDGVTSYINTNYIQSVNGVKSTSISTSLGSYIRTNLIEMSISIGASNSGPSKHTYLMPRYNAGQNYFGVNASVDIVNALVGNSSGFWAASRGNSIINTMHRNGLSSSVASGSFASVTTIPLYICAVNNNGSANRFSTREVAMSFIGSNLINQAQFYTDFQTLATTLGFNV